MMFRTRLLLIFTVAIVAAVAVVELLVLGSTRQAFERSESQRAEALVAAVSQRVRPPRPGDGAHRQRDRAHRKPCATSPSSRTPAEYYDYAAPLAATHDLDLLELVAADGTIVSSAQWPARFGYKEEWLTTGEDWKLARRISAARRTAAGRHARSGGGRHATEGDRKLYVVGGQQLDREFLSTLVLPAGMRVLLYRNLDAAFHAVGIDRRHGPARATAALLRPLIEQVQSERREALAHRRQRRRRRERPRRAASRARQSCSACC